MSVTSGFFDSLNHDRRYNARQMSAIFDGIINDGVFANIGEAFKITADSGVTINIGVGKAWFNSAWVYNDALLPITLEGSEVVLDRIDAVVIEVDHNESVRMGGIKIIKGTPSSSPKRPNMANDSKKRQCPLAYIYRKAGSTTITQANITNMVGTSECPYITGILQVQNIDNIVAQWNDQWNQWYATKIAETDTDASELLAEMKSEFDIWFNDIQTLLDDDVATALAAQVAELQGKFDTLAREGAVYDTIEDSDLDIILGSDGTPIQGKTVFTYNNVNGTVPIVNGLDMNGHRIWNVAEPEMDFDAANAGYVKKIASKSASKASSPRNLLDNSDFIYPINQRGSDYYSNTDGTGSGSYDGSIYSIDRWCIGLGMEYGVELSELINNSATERGTFFQKFDDGKIENGGKYTLAVSFRYGQVYCGVVTAYDTSLEALPDGYSPTITIPERGISLGLEYHPWDIGFRFVISLEPGVFENLEWAAVYEGEYTEETLPKYQPKGYLTELNECLRYYYKGSLQSYGYMYGSSTAYVCVPMPVRMRVTPTVTLGNSIAITVRDAKGTKAEISKLGSNVYRNGNVVRFALNVTDAGLLSNSPLSAGTTGNIEFSANL